MTGRLAVTRRKDLKVIAPQPGFYPEHETEVWILFDFRIGGANSRLIHEKYVWKHRASIERLDQHQAVMTIRPDGVREFAR